MKIHINILILIILPSLIFSQNGSKLFMRVQYSVTAHEDLGKKRTDDWMYLDIGKNESVYYSYFNHIRDSTVQSQKQMGYNAFEIMENLKGTKRGSKDVFLFYSNNKNLNHYSVITADYYMVTESIGEIKWNISNETTSILNYKCFKATAYFKGRQWTVWFTQDIPIKSGPWKLNGLPGLVLRASDSEKHYTFECMAIGKIDKTLQMSDYSKYSSVSKKEFDMLLNKFKTNPLVVLDNKGVTIGVAKDANGRVIDVKQKMKTQYNPIER